MFFTNMARGNPYRPWMEYLVDWKLAERSEKEIREACVRAGIRSDSVRVNRDRTGLALLVQIRHGDA